MTLDNSVKNIWIACSNNELDLIKDLIENKGVSANIQDVNGYAPLHAAVSWNFPELTQYLISKGANVNLKTSDGDTPLHYCEQAELAQILLDNGANPDEINEESKSPYQAALEEEYTELAELLKPLTTVPLVDYEAEGEDSLAHLKEELDENSDVNPLPTSFISKFDNVLKDETIEDEESRDLKLQGLVADLISNKLNKLDPK
ncbi:ankyrin [Conidiobolus coronatus NRRL 28638]|uniref:Ankyrin n=1 Tax=Conidiobolus coronatus (strain ATCC 28846 / CBS 209.66 / NRRL 28638) TaxID=796925 RepID=A0A137PJE5_CONC2|nr:ankyrin [Conidiobolus coronatus NRRL 28638]|eukprot:KXN75105.1 ankyrin [Conidiobolus coronatus NRRL 28638]